MIILLTIMANCATMAWESPLDEMLQPEGTWKSDFVDSMSKVPSRGSQLALLHSRGAALMRGWGTGTGLGQSCGS